MIFFLILTVITLTHATNTGECDFAILPRTQKTCPPGYWTPGFYPGSAVICCPDACKKLQTPSLGETWKCIECVNKNTKQNFVRSECFPALIAKPLFFEINQDITKDYHDAHNYCPATPNPNDMSPYQSDHAPNNIGVDIFNGAMCASPFVGLDPDRYSRLGSNYKGWLNTPTTSDTCVTANPTDPIRDLCPKNSMCYSKKSASSHKSGSCVCNPGTFGSYTKSNGWKCCDAKNTKKICCNFKVNTNRMIQGCTPKKDSHCCSGRIIYEDDMDPLWRTGYVNHAAGQATSCLNKWFPPYCTTCIPGAEIVNMTVYNVSSGRNVTHESCQCVTNAIQSVDGKTCVCMDGTYGSQCLPQKKNGQTCTAAAGAHDESECQSGKCQNNKCVAKDTTPSSGMDSNTDIIKYVLYGTSVLFVFLLVGVLCRWKQVCCCKKKRKQEMDNYASLEEQLLQQQQQQPSGSNRRLSELEFSGAPPLLPAPGSDSVDSVDFVAKMEQENKAKMERMESMEKEAATEKEIEVGSTLLTITELKN